MKISNMTSFEVETLTSKWPDNKTYLTIVVKGTFDINSDNSVKISMEQIPIAYGDEFYDEKNGGNVKFESDLAPFKPRADIVVVGKAYAPNGKAINEFDISLRVGDIKKTIRVIGDRYWKVRGKSLPVSISDPEPFTVMDIVYERSFGGVDIEGGDWCKENPIGKGFFAKKPSKIFDGTPLPNIEDPNNLIRSWKDHPKIVGFGFYGKSWLPRATYFGTYDEKWRKERSPDLPKDFRFEYYNAAHPDLQLSGYLKGNERVALTHLNPNGNISFRLPETHISAIVKKIALHDADSVRLSKQEDIKPSDIVEEIQFNLDTLCLIPDEERFYLVWRGICQINDLTTLEVKEIGIRV